MDANDTIVDQVLTLIGEHNTISLWTIDDLVIDCIRIVQNLVKEHGKGQYKKQVVLTVINVLVHRNTQLDDDTKTILLKMCEYTIPHTIDLFIGLAKGEIDISKMKMGLCGLC